MCIHFGSVSCSQVAALEVKRSTARCSALLVENIPYYIIFYYWCCHCFRAHQGWDGMTLRIDEQLLSQLSGSPRHWKESSFEVLTQLTLNPVKDGLVWLPGQEIQGSQRPVAAIDASSSENSSNNTLPETWKWTTPCFEHRIPGGYPLPWLLDPSCTCVCVYVQYIIYMFLYAAYGHS